MHARYIHIITRREQWLPVNLILTPCSPPTLGYVSRNIANPEK